MTTLYKKDAKGNLRYWEIEQIGDLLIKEHGLVGGEPIVHTEEVEGNSRRDPYDQAEFMMESKIKNQITNGYRANKEEAMAMAVNLNQLGYKRPMTAKRFGQVTEPDLDDADIQYKYNGHRCLIINDKGTLKAYSRYGKFITSIPEILQGLKIPQGVTLDGELYHHGAKLQTISSWIKRRQENTQKLVYICYDAMIDEPFKERYSFISSLPLGDRAVIAPVFAYRGSISQMLNGSVESGYEGLMIRPNLDLPYQDDTQSNSLIKLKPLLDAEYHVFDITPSKDGWAVLHCITNNGKKFRISAPGTVAMKKSTLQNKHLYIGRTVQVEYPELTIDGIPAQPIATYWRNKHNDE